MDASNLNAGDPELAEKLYLAIIKKIHKEDDSSLNDLKKLIKKNQIDQSKDAAERIFQV
jgi:hypothetical protein